MKKDLRKVLDNFFRNNHISDKQSTEEVLELINKAVRNRLPKMLYRHRSCTKYSIRGFRYDSVIAVSPSMFNDPYDCLLKYDAPQRSDRNSKEKFEQLVEHYKRTGLLPDDFENYLSFEDNKKFKIYLDQYIDGQWTYTGDKGGFDACDFIEENMLDPCSSMLHKFSRVSCFSERKDSLLMWSHYADEHKGFVLGYDLNAECNRDALDNLFPVIYSNKRYDASEAVRYMTGEMIKMRNNHNQDQLFYLAAALYKSKDWSYEKEWRLISYGNDEELVEFKLRPSCIIYGSRIDPDDYEELHEIAVSKGIKEYSATIDRSSPYYKMRICREHTG